MENSNLNQNGNKADFPCPSKKIPDWLVLLDNIPTLLLFILGFLIINKLSVIGSVTYLVYSAFSVLWFWWKICPHCHHFNTKKCPCGYGVISSRFFKKKDPSKFQKIFRRNILVMFPTWFVPAGISVYLLINNYSQNLLILTILFSIDGFIIIPLISKFVGCKNCEIKDNCPWMKINKQRSC